MNSLLLYAINIVFLCTDSQCMCWCWIFSIINNQHRKYAICFCCCWWCWFCFFAFNKHFDTLRLSTQHSVQRSLNKSSVWIKLQESIHGARYSLVQFLRMFMFCFVELLLLLFFFVSLFACTFHMVCVFKCYAQEKCWRVNAMLPETKITNDVYYYCLFRSQRLIRC